MKDYSLNEDDTIRALRRVSYKKLREDMAETDILTKSEKGEADLEEFLMVRGWSKDELISQLFVELKGMSEDTDYDDYEYEDYPELDEDGE